MSMRKVPVEDLPAPLDTLGLRFRAAKIRCEGRASDFGYCVKLIGPEPVTDAVRAEAIWLGTRDGGGA